MDKEKIIEELKKYLHDVKDEGDFVELFVREETEEEDFIVGQLFESFGGFSDVDASGTIYVAFDLNKLKELLSHLRNMKKVSE